MKDLAVKLRTYRAKKGWNQAQLADAMGASVSAIFHWENGAHPAMRYIKKMKELGVIHEMPGNRIARARELIGMTRRQLACETGFSVGQIRSWENHHHIPSRRTWRILDEVLFSKGKKSGQRAEFPRVVGWVQAEDPALTKHIQERIKHLALAVAEIGRELNILYGEIHTKQ